MPTRQLRQTAPFRARFFAGTMMGVLWAAANCQAGIFAGDFAPENWVFTPGGPGADGSYSYALWTPLPPDPATSVAVYAAHQFQGQTTLSITVPATEPGYVVNFRTSFYNPTGGNADQSLQVSAPSLGGSVSLGSFPTPGPSPGPVVTDMSVTLLGGETMTFLMFSDTVALIDKKNVPYFVLEQWSVSPVPEASTWFAACGLAVFCGWQFWRMNRGARSHGAPVPA